MKKKEKIAFALIAGAAITAGLVYVFTSDKGNKMKKKVVLKGRQILEELQGMVKEMKCKEEKAEAVS